MAKILQFKLPFDQDLKKHLVKSEPQMKDFRLLTKSLDARKAPNGRKPIYEYRVEVIYNGEYFEDKSESFEKIELDSKPIIIGAGPAGLFAAVRFMEYGVPALLFERGAATKERMVKISRYWKRGTLDEDTNVCYGEGGAGLYSDGKLITRIKSPLVKYVMKKMVHYGAKPEIEFVNNPHLGSNKIRTLITKITKDLIKSGTEIFYNERVLELIFKGDKAIGVRTNKGEYFSDHIIIATGHSAHEIYQHLDQNQVALSSKDFALGVRIEHKRSDIDEIQYGKFKEELGAARYRLSYHNAETQRGTYSFCMCPGGYVLSSGTNKKGIVVNGMSNNRFGSPWSNAALVVSIRKSLDFDENDVFAGLKMQKEIEEKAYQFSLKHASGKELPAMSIKDFLKGSLSNESLPITSSPSKLFKQNLYELLPAFVTDHLRAALKEFERKMPGFITKGGVLIAPETRTSAPITILRDSESLMSISHQGLYPCGEGAGYAGGITSAAVDGIKVVESIIHNHRNLNEA